MQPDDRHFPMLTARSPCRVGVEVRGESPPARLGASCCVLSTIGYYVHGPGRPLRRSGLCEDTSESAPSRAARIFETPTPDELALTVGARLAGAARITTVDIDGRKLGTTRSIGATRAVNSRTADPVEAVRELMGAFGADVAIDAVADPRRTSRRSMPATGPDRGSGRGTDPGHNDGTAAAGRLRPRRGPEVELVQRLPALPRLPPSHRPVPAMPPEPGRIRHGSRTTESATAGCGSGTLSSLRGPPRCRTVRRIAERRIHHPVRFVPRGRG